MGDPASGDISGPFCPNCGNSASTGHEYCLHCGHEIPPVKDTPGEELSGDSTDERNNVESFRQRVRDLETGGWEIERDDHDEVALLSRGIGSLWIHLVLVLFTLGVGNLLYAWYKYTVSPKRVILRVDGEGYSIIDPKEAQAIDVLSNRQTAPVTQFVFGFLVLVVGITVLLTAWLNSDPAAAGFGVVSLASAAHLMSAIL